jgi:hypothetical protein
MRMGKSMQRQHFTATASSCAPPTRMRLPDLFDRGEIIGLEKSAPIGKHIS